MIETIVSDRVATADAFDDPPCTCLYPEEAARVANAVDKRRQEYTTVRHLARQAMVHLGVPAAAIVPGSRREPLWPAGVVGSLTHCVGYRAAALASAEHVTAVGIDAEPHMPLPDRLVRRLALPEELDLLADLEAGHPSVCWDRLLFSAKEAVYKAWFPLAQRWLDFDDATVTLDPGHRTFTVRLHRTGPLVHGVPLVAMSGRWLIERGLIVCVVEIAREPDSR